MTIDSDTLPLLVGKGGNGSLFSVSSETKLILCTDFTELSRHTYACKHEVRLVLTPNEVIVLKKTSESPLQYSLLRKHPLKSVRASELEECLAADAMVFEVPDTVLCYVYQRAAEGAVMKEWLTAVHRCKDELLSLEEEGGPRASEVPKSINGCHQPPVCTNSCEREVAPKPPAFSRLFQRSFSTPGSRRRQTRRNGDMIPIPDAPDLSLASSYGSSQEEGLTRHGSVHGQHLDDFEPSSILNRAASDRELGRRKGIRSRKHILRKKTPSSSDVSSSGSQRRRDDSSSPEPDSSEGPERLFSRVPCPPSPPPPPSSDLQSPFRHTQIRRGHKMVSPRIIQGASVRPRSSTPSSDQSPTSSNKYPRANSTPSVGYHSATLPRRNKSKERTDPILGSVTSPDSLHPAKQLIPAKSPKLLKIFHRRWNSSTGIKVHSVEDGDQAGSLVESSGPSSTKAPPPSPRKLHLLVPKEVALELTLLDAQMLRKIDPQELENGAWMKKTRKVCTCTCMSTPPHQFVDV